MAPPVCCQPACNRIAVYFCDVDGPVPLFICATHIATVQAMAGASGLKVRMTPLDEDELEPKEKTCAYS